MRLTKSRYVEMRNYIESNIEDCKIKLLFIKDKTEEERLGVGDERFLINRELKLLKDILYTIKMADWRRKLHRKLQIKKK